jgi:REP element-mobilizing transposase RayT
MARKLRLEFPGACYHVINRGNYRTSIFESSTAKAAFEACLFEACVKSNWLLHAFVVMRNHFHLAIETPEGNLVAGMHWLQCTFASRFNRLRNERGHLFQGRYKALLVEEGTPLGMVCDYIHLNPVRASLLPVTELEEYRHSSYWYLRRPTARPPFLRLDLVLAAAGQLADTSAGWTSYRDYLVWQAAEGPHGKSTAYVPLSRGWALGSAGFKAALIKDHALAATARAWESEGVREIRQQSWEHSCLKGLKALRRTESDMRTARKAAPWKVALAIFLKERTQASNAWIGKRLMMGSAKYVSYLISMARRSAMQPRELAILAASSDLTP